MLAEEDVQNALKASESQRERYEKLLAEVQKTPPEKRKGRWYHDLSRAYPASRSGPAVARRFQTQQREPNLPIEVHALRLGDVGFVTNPFELYLDYGIRIKARSPALQTFVVQLAGPGSYLPAARSIVGGAYGSLPRNTEVGVEGGEKLVEWSVAVLKELWLTPGTQ